MGPNRGWWQVLIQIIYSHVVTKNYPDILFDIEKENGYSSGVADIPENSDLDDQSDPGVGVPFDDDEGGDMSGDYEIPDNIPIANNDDKEVESSPLQKWATKTVADSLMSDQSTGKSKLWA